MQQCARTLIQAVQKGSYSKVVLSNVQSWKLGKLIQCFNGIKSFPGLGLQKTFTPVFKWLKKGQLLVGQKGALQKGRAGWDCGPRREADSASDAGQAAPHVVSWLLQGPACWEKVGSGRPREEPLLPSF